MKLRKCLSIVAITFTVFALGFFMVLEKSGGLLANNNITIFIDGKYLAPRDVNGMIVNPIIIEGTTYVPIRAISEALNKEVTWDGISYTINITTPYKSYQEVIDNFLPSDLHDMHRLDNTDFHYTEVDLNGDGIDELLIYDRQKGLGQIYTKVGGRSIRKINIHYPGAGDRLCITPDNLFIFSSSGSTRAVGNYTEYFTIENGERNVFAEHRSEYVGNYSVPYFIVNGERVEYEVFEAATEGLLISKYGLKPGFILVDPWEIHEAFLDSLSWTRIGD